MIEMSRDKEHALKLHAQPGNNICYQLPGAITSDMRPTSGGIDSNQTDYDFAVRIYPKRTRELIIPHLLLNPHLTGGPHVAALYT
jgi:hypothetical protein